MVCLPRVRLVEGRRLPAGLRVTIFDVPVIEFVVLRLESLWLGPAWGFQIDVFRRPSVAGMVGGIAAARRKLLAVRPPGPGAGIGVLGLADVYLCVSGYVPAG